MSRITEVVGMEGDVVTMQDVFLAHADDENGSTRISLLGPLQSTGLVPAFLPKFAVQGVDVPNRLFDRTAA